MTIHQLLCFGIASGGGNAALVVQHDHSDADQRQRFARERALPACVFVDTAPGGGVVLDYYYPHTRSPLCLHATLAAGSVLLSRERPSLAVRTAVRGQPLILSLADGDVFIPEMEDGATGVAAGALAAHLGADVTLYQGANLGQPCRIQARAAGAERILIGGAAEFIRPGGHP